MKTTSIRALLLSLGLATFPMLAMSATGNGSPLRVDESAHALEAQTKVNPFDAIALNNEAVKMSRDGNQLDALQLLLRAHRLAPDDKKIERNFKDLNGWMSKRTSTTQTLDIGKPPNPALIEPPPLWNNPPSTSVSPSQAPSTKASTTPRSHSRTRVRTSHSYSRVRQRSSFSSSSNVNPNVNSNRISGSSSVSNPNLNPSVNLNSGSRYDLNQGSVSGNGSLQDK